ncbi:LysE family transporter [Vulcanisaeta distributa]|uniref:Lysine exporter protein (LYSE/YGGA) n=1 Tax=Vulcanisaeta distributa (strain DSM 14429 / JCM 11212 / NBRC 100878 / IC-017) TaxID=572478 RepID=E1QT51_VULDI|nr:LysE family transporter [Vulcanisaeta distributa]ADN49643.1 Lysine exporter protein (LYSE/YGGA) [Vulcanisaeta distributa DSM 14429]
MLGPDFIIKVIVISASGALAPGPLTASAASLGARMGWRAGINEAIGHMTVELPLVLAIAYGLHYIFQIPIISTAFGIVGGAFLLFFAYLTLRDALRGSFNVSDAPRYSSAVVTGAALSLFNPYFIAWWIGVGTPLIMEAFQSMYLIGIGILYVSHVWLDYAWLTLIASLGSVSRLKISAYRVLLMALAIAIAYFGISMIISMVKSL